MEQSDERYNTMCLKSHQLQALKANIGTYDAYDMVYCISRGVRLLAIQLLRNVVGVDTIWIPRQEQIQLLLLRTTTIERLIEEFDDWIFAQKFDHNSQQLTFEMLWLMYYMEKIHGMYWCWSCNLWRLLKYKSIAQEGDGQQSPSK